jgi:CRISPR/Cas system-associated exonuclease Cas4 (RecB family)
MPVKLSPSRLGRFAECPRCFWLELNEGLRRPSGPFPSLPGGLDGEIKAYVDRYRARGELPPELDGVIEERLLADQSFVAAARDWRRAPMLRDETTALVVRGGVDDLLEAADGSLVILDYKTRGYPPTGDGAPDYYRRQLNLYDLIFREAGHETADHAYLLYYYPEAVRPAGSVDFHTELVRVPVDVAAARQLLEAAVATVRGPRPPAAADCDFCRWADARATG